MANLVPIPWQPQFFGTPDTVALLVKASSRAGHNIEVVDGWRSEETQKGYWDAYQAYLNGGPWAPTASSPYPPGQRNHMRGAAWDIKYVTPQNRAAMIWAGFIPDAQEDWHFNNPNWRNMPIIPTNTGTAGGGATPIPPKEEPDVKNKYHYEDRRVRALAPGVSAYLTDAKQQVKNIVGAPGDNYSITPHVGVTGLTPGDTVTLVLEWSNKGKVSRHYTVDLVAGANGVASGSPEFKRAVKAGDSVFLLITASKGNKSTGETAWIDSDAWLFS